VYGAIGIAETGVGNLSVSLSDECFIPTLGNMVWKTSVLSEWSCQTEMSKGKDQWH